jgi:diguanylate cyclase (GGDEF)-like protein/PAS domain S-box-containing protein
VHGDDHGPGADLLANVPDAVVHLDRSWRYTYANAAAERLLGLGPGELVGCRMQERFPATAGSGLEERLTLVLEHGEPQQFDYHSPDVDRWFELRAFPAAGGVTVFFRDVDERRRQDDRRAAEVAELAAVLEALPAATVLIGQDGRIESTNSAWRANGELLRQDGLEPGGVGDDYVSMMSVGLTPADHTVLAAGIRRLAEGDPRGRFDHDYACRLGDKTYWFQLQASRVEPSKRIVVSHTDITERVRGEQELAWQAGHDDLTGLPNRARMLTLIDEALEKRLRRTCRTDPARSPGTADSRGQRGGQLPGAPSGTADVRGQRGGQLPGAPSGTALLFLDLDGFKMVNDSLGHQVGDALLVQVAGRLLDQVRPGDSVGRLGGDQFLVLAQDCDSAEAAALAFRLQQSFAAPFIADGLPIPLSGSIGVAVAHAGTHDAHALLSDADAAMYAAKGSGRDRVHLFSPGLRDAARWRLEVATRLRDDAIDQLVIHYQPIVRLDTGIVEGVEALVRWNHPERGLLAPDTFLAVAEETGQVIPITRRLLDETTRQAAAWAAQGLRLRISVNISARHFSTETLVHDVRTALHESGLPPDQLILELTETSVAEDPTRAEDQLTVLRGMGVRIAIDDFGTGWSSLAQLFALPIGTLKIDRSLLAAAERASSADTGAVMAAIVALTRTLGIRTVAEGVENLEHLRMVETAGCDLAQGWLLGRPMPAADLPAWVARVHDAGGDLDRLAAAIRRASPGGAVRPLAHG